MALRLILFSGQKSSAKRNAKAVRIEIELLNMTLFVAYSVDVLPRSSGSLAEKSSNVLFLENLKLLGN